MWDSAALPAGWRSAYWQRNVLPQIRQLGQGLAERSEEDLRRQSRALRFRVKSGEPSWKLLPEAYSLVREAARRTIGLEHYDVQMLGGIVLFRGGIAEMETGEGKTLTATLPLYLRALSGKGCHLATVNDYLARRDAEWMGPIYRLLGLTVGVIETQMPQAERRKSYACDITYGTAKEFGFDFLRDRLLLRENGQLAGGNGSSMAGGGANLRGEQPVQREAFFALVDEADSVLIDEARTPLIISSLPGEAERITACCYMWSASVADQFQEGEDYQYDHEKRTVELTIGGRQRVRWLSKPELMNSVGLIDIYEYAERAIKVAREFFLDQHYVVRDGEIVIVDESTGRLAEGRKWRAGIHQAIEAKEGVKVTVPTSQAARVTIQDFFLRYRHLAGMTGTARSSAREFRKVYRLSVVAIPTNRPNIRFKEPDRIFASGDQKWAAVVEEVERLHRLGRPVLIGTRSIDRSEALSRRLADAGIPHQVLNAHRIAEEAQIVARAGEPGRVTVATNMAGRGTDIKLGDGVAELGGLHVIVTELHDSARIDRQLMGRCGRQGDPGTQRQYLALDDDILVAGFGPQKAARLRASGSSGNGGLMRWRRVFRAAQNRVESRNFRGRRVLLHYEKQRRKMQLEMGQDPYLDSPD
jgi:preprotein translocase subunit SecA